MSLTQEQQQRADEVWKRLIGLFGGEAVKRKYGDTMPPEWRGIVAKLNALELERGMRRLVHSGRDQVPTLPAFVKLCRAVGGDGEFNEGRSGLPALPNPDRWQGDAWGVAANFHLLAHITRRLKVDSRCYGRPASARGLRTMTDANADASPEFVAAVGLLVQAKNTWAKDMREIAEEGGVDVKLQRASWDDLLGAAETEIAARKAQQEAA